MSGGSRKRVLDPGNNEKTKTRKEDGQVLLETDSFDCIDAVISELRSFEGHVAHLKFDGFRKILEKLERSGILFRRTEGPDADAKLRFLFMEDYLELHRLVDEHVAKSGRATFEEHLERIGSDDRLVINQMNQRETANHVFETVDIPRSHELLQQDMFFPQSDQQSSDEGQVIESKPDEPNMLADGGGFLSSPADLEESREKDSTLPIDTNTVRDRSPRGYGDMWSTSDESTASDEQISTWDEVSYRESEFVKDPPPPEALNQELHHSQAIEQSTASLKKEEHMDLKPNAHNVEASGDYFLPSSAVKKESQEFARQQRKIAQIKFNDELREKFLEFCHEWGNTSDVEEAFNMIEHRTRLLKRAKFKFCRLVKQQFSLKLLTKLRGFEQRASLKCGPTFGSPNLDLLFSKLVDMLQSDARIHANLLLPKSRCIADLDLLKYITSDNNIDAAQYILRSRNLRLRNISFVLTRGLEDLVELNLCDSELGDRSAGINYSTYRRFKYGTDVNKEHTVQLFKIITQFYDVSQASITLRKYGSNNGGMIFQLLKSAFGPPPTDQNGKIRIKEMIVESPGMTEFLRWFCPVIVVICCDSDSEVFIDEPSLTIGVEMIELRRIQADRLMEKCSAPLVLLSNSTWSNGSIFSVLTAHRLSADKCSPMDITYQCHQNGTGSSTIKDWEELFELWSRTFEAIHGNIGRAVTLRTVRDNNGDYVELILH